MLEKHIQNAILNFLEECGCDPRIIKTQGTYDPVKKCFRKSKNRFNKKGTSDILAWLPDRVLFIEVKSKIGRVSPEQREFICQANKRKQVAFVARSVEQVYDQLERFWPEIQEFKHLLKKYSSVDL